MFPKLLKKRQKRILKQARTLQKKNISKIYELKLRAY